MVAAEPELELVRRVLPLSLPAIVIVAVVAAVVGGTDAAISAGLGTMLVFANFVFFAVSVAYAARISLTLLFGAGLAAASINLVGSIRKGRKQAAAIGGGVVKATSS